MLYLGARASYHGMVYPAMGNHECNGDTEFELRARRTDGEPPTTLAISSRMVEPIGEHRAVLRRAVRRDRRQLDREVRVHRGERVERPTQASWLERRCREPTTYTFVVRHEPHDADTAPGVDSERRRSWRATR